MALVAAAWGAACRRAPAGEVADATLSRAAEPDAQPFAVVRPAIRCAECHGKMHAEWEASTHARAATSALYRAMRAQAAPRLLCDRCHAPLAALAEPGDPVIREGVTCEVCHSIVSVDDGAAGGSFVMSLAENVQRGPRCDAKDQYFHKMGCSPLHAEARLCAACHTLHLGDLPVFTDYDDWQEGPYAGMIACQDCHMPRTTAEVAEGSPPRDGVAHHGFLGRDRSIFTRALTGKVSARRVRGGIEVAVRVKNANAGHPVPGGLPGRQILVRVRALDGRGATLARGERIYQRLLVDPTGAPAPFYRATREASDNRLRARELRVERFVLDAPTARLVRLEVVRRAVAPEIARAVGQPLAVEEVLATAQVAPGAAVDWRQ